jgi:NADPH-dependent curcumin reductase CurA
MPQIARTIQIVARPVGLPKTTNCARVDLPLPAPAAGKVLLQTHRVLLAPPCMAAWRRPAWRADADRAQYLATMPDWLATGAIKAREDVTHGLDQMVPACLAVLEGRNVGKGAVHLAD